MQSSEGFPINLTSRPNVRIMAQAKHGLNLKIETYRIHGLWCMHFYTYHADLRVDKNWYKISPGSISMFPPDIDLEYRFHGPSEHRFAHFSVAATHSNAIAPVIQVAPDRFDRLYEMMGEAVSWFGTQRERAEIRLWDLLWSVCQPLAIRDGVARDHPAVALAKQAIEAGLSRRVLITELAEQSGVSHNHLIRLFQASTGMSIVQYIRHRRVEQAVHLLRNSTIPIKTIAAQVGIADVHLFNKTIRREMGQPPTAVRAGAASDRV
jgi:AraC-like DNA-binding protein